MQRQRGAVQVFPEVSPIPVPSIVWGVIAIACWQAVVLIGLRLAVLARSHKFGPPAYGWLHAIVGCLLVFIVLVVSAFIALNVMAYGTPGVLLGLIGGGLIALQRSPPKAVGKRWMATCERQPKEALTCGAAGQGLFSVGLLGLEPRTLGL